MKKPWFKKFLTQLLKLGLTVLALYFIYTRIDLQAAWEHVQRAHPGWLVLAFCTFVLSKGASAMRLLDHFAAIGLRIPSLLNLKLYALGMYYNLFLPGGIGGDGYKAYWLNKHYKSGLKALVQALLLDRINGLVALVALATGMIAWVALPLPSWVDGLVIPAIFILYLLHFFVLSRFFPPFTQIFRSSLLWSLAVQGLQLLCVSALYLALKVPDPWLPYAFVFLVSSIVSVLPLTIGGIGSREVVFLLGAEVLFLNQDTAVTLSLLFYGITALTSFLGSYFAWNPSLLRPTVPYVKQ